MKKPNRRTETVKSKQYRFHVLFDLLAEGGYQVSVPLLPGVVTYGRTLAEARSMARDALRCHLEGLQKAGEPIPSEQKAHTEILQIALSA